MSIRNVKATPNGTRMMWKPSVNAICSRAGSSWSGSAAASRPDRAPASAASATASRAMASRVLPSHSSRTHCGPRRTRVCAGSGPTARHGGRNDRSLLGGRPSTMCRLLGWATRRPTTLHDLLGQEELLEFTELSTLHADGWGVARATEDGVKVHKRPDAARTSRAFGLWADTSPSDLGIAH